MLYDGEDMRTSPFPTDQTADFFTKALTAAINHRSRSLGEQRKESTEVAEDNNCKRHIQLRLSSSYKNLTWGALHKDPFRMCYLDVANSTAGYKSIKRYILIYNITHINSPRAISHCTEIGFTK